MLLPIGSRLLGKVIATGQELSDWEDLFCIVEFGDGSQGFLCHEDLFWSNERFEGDTQKKDILSQIAKSFLGREIEVVVIHHYNEKMMVGRKQLLRNPFWFLKNHLDLTFDGVILSVSSIAAKVLMDMDWEKVGIDRYTRMVGILPRTVCQKNLWKSFHEGQRLHLKLGPCDIQECSLLFLPFSWRPGYKRGQRIRGSGGEVFINPLERSFLKVDFQCPECGAFLEEDLLKIFTSTGLDGKGIGFWVYDCPSCNANIGMEPSWKAAIEHLAMLEEGNPNLVDRIKKVFQE